MPKGAIAIYNNADVRRNVGVVFYKPSECCFFYQLWDNDLDFTGGDIIVKQMNPSQEDLKKLQDAIYRDKVERARKMTEEERFMEGLELSEEVMQRMHHGVMWQLGIEDEEKGWREVKRRMDRLDEFHNKGFLVTEKSTRVKLA